MNKRYEINNEEWERIKDLLPPERTGRKGRPGKDNRSMLNGMLWIARSGAQWRSLPECYGLWQSVYARFRLWQETGVFEMVFRALSANADMENLSIDSTSIRVHESANGNKKGLQKS
jgi:transposase